MWRKMRRKIHSDPKLFHSLLAQHERQWPILLTWINFNPSMDKLSHAQYVWDEITYPFLIFNGCTVEV